ncbi:hypothetical protein CAPTEDRAFT_215056 [Capitella teleta]|uniref:Tumor protein p53-inducible protein 11 n=1 Tax=Capitella teleta TaxID=283909 RepID=R7UR50_CAPTE|nr:hypothetical protein CAPTEDRAFT_215056 [Capitella teleta]|eukprot:ELU08650.1 hypothetical protein CAPTEDRAFT_215056 [Capitella teleta]
MKLSKRGLVSWAGNCIASQSERVPCENGTRETKREKAMKHSSGDLHSRLKTRKLLGVGETDDGDVHRSKLSQILGHSEQLYMKLPRGLRIWQFSTALIFTVMAIWALFFPRSLHRFVLNIEAVDEAVLPFRLYGVAILALAILFWSTLRVQDREVIRWSLLGSAVFFFGQFIVILGGLIEHGTLLSCSFVSWFHCIFITSFSTYYYYVIGEKGVGTSKCKLTKSSSMKDLSNGAKDEPKAGKSD